MDVTFSETEMFFATEQTHPTRQWELVSIQDEYRWFDMPLELSNERVEINQEYSELAASTLGSNPSANVGNGPSINPCIDSGLNTDTCIEWEEHDVESLGSPSADPRADFGEQAAECSSGPRGEPLTKSMNGPELIWSTRRKMDSIEAANPANNNHHSPCPRGYPRGMFS
ncbi:hypothetical protein ACFX12_045824 [Malus domestica]